MANGEKIVDFVNEIFGINDRLNILEYLFDDARWAIHLVVLSIFIYKIVALVRKYTTSQSTVAKAVNPR